MPLGYVKQELFDQERDGRIRAEVSAQHWKERCESMGEANHRLEQDLKDRHHQYANLVTELLNGLRPKEAARPETPDGAVFEEMTYAQIMAQPAVGKREMEMRDRRAQAALERMRSNKQDEQERRRQELLTDEEKRATMPDFDSTLGVFIEEDQANVSSN